VLFNPKEAGLDKSWKYEGNDTKKNEKVSIVHRQIPIIGNKSLSQLFN